LKDELEIFGDEFEKETKKSEGQSKVIEEVRKEADQLNNRLRDLQADLV
jgi:archaellum component FlaC